MSIYIKVDEVAKILGISPSTVKKYYLLVEEKGYRFRRTVQGQVSFSEQDVKLFQKIILTKNEPGMSVQKAVESVISSITDIIIYQEREEPENNSDITVMMKEMKEMITNQHKLLTKQQKEIEEIRLEQKNSNNLIEGSISERDKNLLESLRTIQEVKQMISASKEKKWWEFWK